MHRGRGFILSLTRFCPGMLVPGPAQEPGAGMTKVKGGLIGIKKAMRL